MQEGKKQMPEQENSLNRYVHDFFSFIFSELKENVGKIVGNIGEVIIFKKILKKYAVFLVLTTAATITLLYGLGALISSFLPSLRPGTVHMIIGIFAIIIAMAYMKREGGG